MKKLMNKNFIQKIVIAILIVLSFNFVVPTFSSADFGGILWTPIRWLVTGIGDTILYWLNFFFVGFTYEEATDYLENPYKPSNLNAVAKFDSDNSDLINRDGGILDVQINRSEDMGTGKEIPIIEYSPDMIFANKVPGLDANYINPKETTGTFSISEDVSITKTLQSTIATWYISLRNLVVVSLLSILLYVAIRMIISSTASDKAKYKKMLMDWLISFCLVFFMHYIMSFTMSLIDIISSKLADSASNITVILGDGDYYFNTNIMGYCRFMTQSDEGIETMGFTILYIALVVYTLKFTWEYMKRSIKMAFLTLMAPLVTLTYAIDKMGDGKAQAFNAWLKEYVFTALIQPFHLLIYSIFMGASMNIAARNPLYAILFLAFLTPAEKLLRKFFGFDKEASGGSSFAGGFGGAAAYNIFKGAISKGAQGLQHAKSGGGRQNQQIRQKNNNMIKDPNAPNGNLNSFKNGQGNTPKLETGGNTGGQGNTPELELRENTNRQENLQSYQTPQERMADAYNENYGTSDWNPQEYAAMQQGVNIPNLAQSDSTLKGKNKKEKEWKQDENWGIGKWASENFIKPAASKVGGGIKNIASAAENKFKETGAYTRVIKPGTAKIKDLASKAKNSKPVNSLVKSGAARALKNSAKGALRVGGRALLETGKVAGKLAAGTAVGAIGLGMGIAGDDIEDVLTYAAGGFALGYSALPSIAGNAVQDVRSVGNTIRSDYELGAYGSTEAALRQQYRDTIHNPEIMADEKDRMTRENGVAPTKAELRQRMEQVADYQAAGVTDSSTMHKAMKIEKEINEQLENNSNMNKKDRNKTARDQAIEIAKIADEYSAKDLRDTKKVDQLRESLVGKLTEGSSGLSSDNANTTAEGIINNIKKIKGV